MFRNWRIDGFKYQIRMNFIAIRVTFVQIYFRSPTVDTSVWIQYFNISILLHTEFNACHELRLEIIINKCKLSTKFAIIQRTM